MGRSKTSKAFALPTVLIASIVLLTILAVSVTATAAVRTTLKNQYYIQLAQIAGESGVAYAKACLAANANVPQWTNAKPLTPATDCTGTNQLPGGNADCPSDPACSVTVNGNVRSSFSVPQPTVDGNGKALTIPNNGYVDILRTSNGAVWRTYKQPSVQAAVVPDLCSGNATAARGWNAAIKMPQQDALPSASTAQTIGIANTAYAGTMYFRKDFNANQTASYDLNVYTSSSQDIAQTYIDGQLVATTAGSNSTATLPLTGGCHVMVVKLTNATVAARASDFTLSLSRKGAAIPAAVSDTTWRVSSGDATHFSSSNYYEAANSWEEVATRGIWNDPNNRWGGNPTNWSAVSGDTVTQWISTSKYTNGTLVPNNTSALFRGTQPFTLSSADSVRVTTYCDNSCELYLDGDLIMSNSTGPSSKLITIQAGTHTFGVRLTNDGTTTNPAGFIFAAVDITDNNKVIARTNVDWDVTTEWTSTPVDSYSYDATFTPTPAVLPSLSGRVLVVGGGGGGGSDMGGGGGGGGVVYDAAHSLSPGSYAVTVGGGGSGAPAGLSQVAGSNGGDSSFDTLRAYGGGGGGSEYSTNTSPPGSGASAGGSAGANQTLRGSPVVSQGNGSSITPGAYYPTGGGGAGSGGAANPATGGTGIANGILGTSYYFGGGGGGSGYTGVGGNGGNGGGGGGAVGTTTGGAGLNSGSPGGGGTTVAQTNRPGGNAGANTGGGGGGGSHYNSNNYGGNGGSGIVVIAVPTGSMTIDAPSAIVTTSGGFTIYRFNASGTFTVTAIN